MTRSSLVLFSRRSNAGLTLIELLTVIAVIAVLATIAVPNFQQTIKNNQITGQHNELVALITFARSEALRRSGPVSVVVTESAGESIASVRPGLPTDEGTDILRQISLTGVLLTAPDDFSFNSRGYIRNPDSDEFLNPSSISITLEHVNCTSPRQVRALEILATGQLTIDPDAECSS